MRINPAPKYPTMTTPDRIRLHSALNWLEIGDCLETLMYRVYKQAEARRQMLKLKTQGLIQHDRILNDRSRMNWL